MKLINKKLFFLSLLIIGFTYIFIFISFSSDEKVNEEYKNLTSQYIYTLKKDQIYDIVGMIHTIAETALVNGYKLFEKNLLTQSENITTFLHTTPKEQWCESLLAMSAHQSDAFFNLKENNVSLCQSENFPKILSLAPLFKRDVLRETKMDETYSLTLGYPKEAIHAFVKQRIAHLIHALKFKNSDVYVWVNEVVDYRGGEGYAIRRIHPNLPQTEGMVLSTHTQDIKGNLPYLTELEGIKKDKEVYFDYYFKKKTNDSISHKLAYARLFEPFDWIMVTGVYLDDIEGIIHNEEKVLEKKLRIHHYFVIAISTFLALLLITFIYKKEKYEISSKEHELEVLHHHEEVKNYKEVLYSMLDLIEKRDPYTAGHTERVAQYAVLIAEAMHLNQEDIDALYEAAIMHDIGKVSTPDAILLKPGLLSQSEYKIIQDHLMCGYEILNAIQAFQKHAEIMRNHHERYDGKGYPRGLKANEIPLLSHILILVDAFDAMTSKRIYKSSKSLEEALHEVEELKGKQFSPEVVDVALPVLKHNGLIPAEHNDLSNEYEAARVVYYYKDALTGLYNYNYLEHLLSFEKDTQKRHYHCCYFVNIKHFGQYNMQYGWTKGNEKLMFLAEKLNTLCKPSPIFRVYGDDFLILNEVHIELNKEVLKQVLEIGDDILDLTLHHIDIDKIKMKNFKDFLMYIESFIKSIKHMR